MKKVILPLAIAAVMSLGASAQLTPNTFNYQGLAQEKAEAIEVTLTLNNGDEAVYAETHEVTTNAAGAFTVVVGEGTATTGEWNAIDWESTDLVLVTEVNGAVVSKAPLKAVPYANLAAGYVGQEYIEADLADLVLANRVNMTDIAQLKIDVEAIADNGGMSAELIDTILEDIDNLKMVTDDIAGIQEVLRMKADVADVADLQEEVSGIQADLIKFQEDIISEVALAEDLNALKADFDNVVENLEMLTPWIELVDERLEALENVTDDIAGISEVLRMKADVADVADLQEEVSGIQADLIKFQEDIISEVALAEDVAEVKEAVEANTASIQQLALFQQTFDEEYMSVIDAAIQENVAAIQDNTDKIVELSKFQESFNDEILAPIAEAIEATNAAVNENADRITELSKFQESFNDEILAPIAEAIEAIDVTDEVQTLMEAIRMKADVAEVAELQEEVSGIQADLIKFQEDIVSEVALQEDLDEVKADVADVRATVKDLANFQATFDEEYMTAIGEAIAAVDVTEEVQTLVEGMRMKANVSDVTALQEEVSGIQADLIKFQEDLISEVVLQDELADVKTDLAGLGELANNAGTIASTVAEDVEFEVKPEIAALKEQVDQLQDLVDNIVATLSTATPAN